MGISGFVAGALILFGITATGRSLETVTAAESASPDGEPSAELTAVGSGGGAGERRAPAGSGGGGGQRRRLEVHGLGQQLVGAPARPAWSWVIVTTITSSA